MIKQFGTLIICCLISAFAFAAEDKSDNTEVKMNITENGVYLADFNTAALQKMFDYLEYDEYINPAGNEYPRIFVKNMKLLILLLDLKVEKIPGCVTRKNLIKLL